MIKRVKSLKKSSDNIVLQGNTRELSKSKKIGLSILLSLSTATVHATEPKKPAIQWTEKISNFLQPKSNENYKKVQLQQFNNFQFDQSKVQEHAPPNTAMSLNNAVEYAVQRNPEIAQRLSILASQNAMIDIVKAQYFPQITGGIGTGNLTSSQRDRQMLSLTATQLLYDFGKVKASVDTQKIKLELEQANVLLSIESIAYQVCAAIINIERYRKSIQISEQQISGIQHILDIANLRARAGISSLADPIQAESYLQSAQSSLIAQQSLLQQYQQRLSILLGFDITSKYWEIPTQWVQASDLFTEPDFEQIPKMIVAQTEVEVAKAEKKQTSLSHYPTISIKAGLSQSLNGVNPNNNKNDSLDQSISIEASSNFYQGGANAARNRVASYAETAARSKVNAVYLTVLDLVRTTRENIENKQHQMQVLEARQSTTLKTRELYQEQYKLGTRTVLDLLNAELAIHAAANELEGARYDIYTSLAQYIETTGRSRQAYQLDHISIQGFEVQP